MAYEKIYHGKKNYRDKNKKEFHDKKNYHEERKSHDDKKDYHEKKKEFVTEEQVTNSTNLGEAFPLSLNTMRSWHSDVKNKNDFAGENPKDQLDYSSLAKAIKSDSFQGLILTLENKCVVFEKRDNIKNSNFFLAAYARIKGNLEKQHIAGVLFKEGYLMLSGIPDYKKTIAELNGGGEELFNTDGFNAVQVKEKKGVIK